MGFNNILPIRAVQALFAIIVLGLTAYVVNDWWYYGSPSEVDFLLFTSIWTILALAFLMITPGRFPSAAHPYAILGVEAVTMIFWFAGFIAVAVLVGDTRCRGWGPCRAATAATVFGAIEWLLFVATTVFAGLGLRRNSGTHVSSHTPTTQINAGTTA